MRTLRHPHTHTHTHTYTHTHTHPQGARSLGVSLRDFLCMLRDAGCSSLPGTAAEVLQDDVRAVLCPDKLNTEEWLQVRGPPPPASSGYIMSLSIISLVEGSY